MGLGSGFGNTIAYGLGLVMDTMVITNIAFYRVMTIAPCIPIIVQSILFLTNVIP